jgi:hypothetical protein
MSKTFKKLKLGLQQTAEAHRVLISRCSQIFYTISLEMAVRLWALHTSCPFPSGTFVVLISVRSWVDPQDNSVAGGIRSSKNPITTLGIEPMAQCLIQLCYCIPSKNLYSDIALSHSPSMPVYSRHRWNITQYRNEKVVTFSVYLCSTFITHMSDIIQQYIFKLQFSNWFCFLYQVAG